MEVVDTVRSAFGDAFLTLPLLLTGALFLIGTLTSNIGMLFLFFGMLILVPSLGFLFNGNNYGFSGEGLLNLFAGVVSTLLVSLTIGKGFGETSSLSYLSFLLYLVPISTFFTQPGTNIFRFFRNLDGPASKACSFIPGLKEDETPYFTPSLWITNIVFFCTFVMANAAALYNQPVPDIKGAQTEEIRQDRIKRLAERVANRKAIATGVIVVTAVVLCLMLYIRFRKTECEGAFIYSLVPIALTATTAWGYFNWMYKSCGIRPADILGVVQGLINPDLIDNPIVCVGSAS
jgi:hypothetical protein